MSNGHGAVACYLGAITAAGSELLSDVENMWTSSSHTQYDRWSGSSSARSRTKNKLALKLSLNILLPVKRASASSAGIFDKDGFQSLHLLEESMRHWEVCSGYAEIDENKLEGE